MKLVFSFIILSDLNIIHGFFIFHVKINVLFFLKVCGHKFQFLINDNSNIFLLPDRCLILKRSHSQNARQETNLHCVLFIYIWPPISSGF